MPLRVLVLLLLALGMLAAPAHAEPVLVVDAHGGAAFRDDPALPADVLTAAPPGGVRPCAAPPAAPGAQPAAAGPTVPGALRRALRAHRITRAERDAWLADYRRAQGTAARMRNSRRTELRAVVASVEALARRGALTASRMPAAFLQLRRNAEFWPTRSFPRPPQPERKPCTGGSGLGGARVKFEGDPVVFQWYRGQGLQIQPLANFGKANALWSACRPPEPGAEREPDAPPCRPEELRALLDRMVALASRRGGFTAWEYFFAFGGGAPPWISGLAQGTGIQALTRGSQLLGDRRYLRVAGSALGAFEAAPPLGVRARSSTGQGRHYLIYSFSSLRVLNGFLQALVGLRDYATATRSARARRLFVTGDRAARRELPLYDTGAWSRYSAGGSESDLGYHRLVRGFLSALCERTGARAYCARAATFDRYLHERARVRLARLSPVRAGATALVRFTLSKLSCVTLRVVRDGRVVHERTVVMPRGRHAFAYRPARPGDHTVQVQALDLLNHRTLAERALTVRRRAR